MILLGLLGGWLGLVSALTAGSDIATALAILYGVGVLGALGAGSGIMGSVVIGQWGWDWSKAALWERRKWEARWRAMKPGTAKRQFRSGFRRKKSRAMSSVPPERLISSAMNFEAEAEQFTLVKMPT